MEAAAAFVVNNRQRYTPDALRARLREFGYAEAVIDAAFRAERAERREAERAGQERPAGSRDLRGRAATIVIAVAVAAWVVVALISAKPLPPGSNLDFGPLILSIMAVVLGLVVLVSLLVVGLSKKLRRGADGLLVAAVVLPVIVVLGIGGTCLVMVTPR